MLKEHGRIDFLVNNAGITRDHTVRKMTVEEWESVLQVNLSGPFFMIKAVLDTMVEQGFGRIVNVSSVVGEAGNFGQANYSAAKAGLIGLTKTVALEVAKRGITVNAVAPGFINTDMTKAMPEAAIENGDRADARTYARTTRGGRTTRALLARREGGLHHGRRLQHQRRLVHVMPFDCAQDDKAEEKMPPEELKYGIDITGLDPGVVDRCGARRHRRRDDGSDSG